MTRAEAIERLQFMKLLRYIEDDQPCLDALDLAIAVLSEPPAPKPEQEPVAWMRGKLICRTKADEDYWASEGAVLDDLPVVPLYPHPAPTITVEEVAEIIGQHVFANDPVKFFGIDDAARAIMDRLEVK